MTQDPSKEKKPTTPKPRPRHVVLTSHPGDHGPKPVPINWGQAKPMDRGPIIGTVSDSTQRNVIGTHSGSYTVYRALAVATGALEANHKPDLTNTSPVLVPKQSPSWSDPARIISMDPFGAVVSEAFGEYFQKGYNIQPTIAITKAHIYMPEMQDAVKSGLLKVDNKLVMENGNLLVVKAAIEPVWYLPGIADRCGIDVNDLRRIIFEQTGGMFPELITRHDLKVFLPPIGGLTVYLFGSLDVLDDPTKPIAVRVHDECNGSDVFGSDICTCRPYLAHGIEVCVETAQKGGLGVIVYSRKEGRALGEVTKFLVYNARKRQEGGDRAAEYFARTECIAGVQDMRLQEFMPDVLHWLGLTKIDHFVSMSDMKHDAVVQSGIAIHERVEIPMDRIPKDAQVEIDAKRAAGYYSHDGAPDDNELSKAKGRELDGKG